MSKPLHLDRRGRARMVDVGAKKTTRRRARAEGRVQLSRKAFAALSEGRLSKGDAFAVARIAGIQAAKRTSEIVPLCHPIALDSISVDIVLAPSKREAVVTAEASIRARTGVEMEALVAVAAACLAIYDMVKSLDRSCRISDIRLVAKSGGSSGEFRAH